MQLIFVYVFVLLGWLPAPVSISSGSINHINQEVNVDVIEQQVFKQCNDYRKQIGLPELEWSQEVYNQALAHSEAMAQKQVPFGHTGFELRAENIKQSVPDFLAGVAENVAFGKLTAKEVMAGWLNSKGHKKNIEGNFTASAVAIAVDSNNHLYFTQIFIKTEPKLR